MRPRLALPALALALVACGEPTTDNPTDCVDAPPGPSGGLAEGTITLCVIDEGGAPIAGASVSVSGMAVGISDDAGRLDVTVGPGNAIEVSSGELVPHTLLGVTSRRYGVELPRRSAPTRTVTGTLTGIGDLRLPPAGYRRVVEIRAGSLFAPLSLTDALVIGAPSECTLAGDECTFTLEVDERVSRVNATVVDTTSAFADRLDAAFSVSEPIVDGMTTLSLPGREGGLMPIDLGAGTDVTVAVPGARVGGDVMLFGSPSATDIVPVPDASVASTPWLAVIYGGASDELHSSVLVGPAASTSAPPAPTVSNAGNTLRVPSERLATISLGRGNEELWRATVLDGRATVSLPDLDADRVAVIVHAGSSFAADQGVLDRIEAVVTLPIVR